MGFNAISLHSRLFISIDQEEGLDYGGVAREWFIKISRDLQNPMYCLFKYTTENSNYTLQINPQSSINPNHLVYFRFVGRFLGLVFKYNNQALFHQAFIDVSFDPTFFKQLLGRTITIHDLKHRDEEIYNSLMWIKYF